MSYVFVSYSEIDDKFKDVSELIVQIEREVFRQTGLEPDFRKGRSAEAGPLSASLKKEIEGASVFMAVFSDHYAEPRGTAWRECKYALSLVSDAKNAKGRDYVLPVLFREPVSSAARWREFHAEDVNCADLTESWSPVRRSSPEFHNELTRVASLLKKSLFGAMVPAPTPQEGNRTKEDVNRSLKDISDIVANSHPDTVFADELIYNVLEEVKKEVTSISEATYAQDISLGRSFIVRAKAIFRSATTVVAVSLDSPSNFWTGENTRQLALDYTRVQPVSTRRLFVFSSPESMLMHRWVLAEHFEKYGQQGKVLMTSLARWQAYLRRGEIRELPDLPSLTEDFGILSYAAEGRRLIARLSASQLTFRAVAGSKFMSAFSDDLERKAETRPHADGACLAIPIDGHPFFWSWRDAYSVLGDDLAWLRCVADVFDGDIDFGPSYKASVMHNVLFNPPPDRNPLGDGTQFREFEQFIKEVIFSLLQIEVGDEQLVKSIWFGRYANEIDVAANDPIHQNRILREPSVWKFCLSMTFQDQDALREFYECDQHGKIRRRIYEFLDPNVALLYQAVEKSGNSDESNVGSAIERIISKYMLRMDYMTPDPYFIYRAVAAPEFASLDDDLKRQGV